MATYTEPARPLEFLVSEGNGQISRDQIVLVSGAGALVAGRVLGKVTASGKYKAYDNTASDGTATLRLRNVGLGWTSWRLYPDQLDGLSEVLESFNGKPTMGSAGDVQRH